MSQGSCDNCWKSRQALIVVEVNGGYSDKPYITQHWCLACVQRDDVLENNRESYKFHPVDLVKK